jgi:hypothetical protein
MECSKHTFYYFAKKYLKNFKLFIYCLMHNDIEHPFFVGEF